MRESYKNVESVYRDVKRRAVGQKICGVMILVSFEVDSMSATKILTQILRSDNIPYSIVPVNNLMHIRKAFEKSLAGDVSTIFLINCGAIYNIPKIFNLEKGGDVRVVIMDNHRPIHLANVYSRYNVVVFDDYCNENESDDFVPSDGSVLSMVESDADNLSSDEDSEGIEDDDNDEDDEDILEEEDEEEDQRDKEAEFDDENEDENYEEKELDELDASDGNSSSDEEVPSDESKIEKNEERKSDDEIQEISQEPAVVNELTANDMGSSSSNVTNHDLDDMDISKNDDQDIFEDGNEDDGETHDEETIDHEKQLEDATELGDEIGDEEVVVGRRRKALDNQYDPRRIRQRTLRHYYLRNVTYTSPTSFMMLHLLGGKYGSHVPLDLLWQVILGVTDQFLRYRITEHAYEEYCWNLKMYYLSNHFSFTKDRKYVNVPVESSATDAINAPTANNNGSTDSNCTASFVQVQSSQAGNISEEMEYRCYLYRHWSLFESLVHSPYLAAKMGLWQSQGSLRLQELLAKIGLPLSLCKQAYAFLTPRNKDLFRVEITKESTQDEYRLRNPSFTYMSFLRYTNFKTPVAATDVVLASRSLLEGYASDPRHEMSSLEVFWKWYYDSSATSAASSSQSQSQSMFFDDDDEDMQAMENLDDMDSNAKNNRLQLSAAPENSFAEDTRLAAFNQSFDCLNLKNEQLLKKAIQQAIEFQKVIVRKATLLLEGDDSILKLPRLYYCFLHSEAGRSIPSTSNSSSSAINNNTSIVANSATGTGSSSTPSTNLASSISFSNEVEVNSLFGRPQVLTTLGQYIVDVKRSLPTHEGGWSEKNILPLILLSEKPTSYLIVGISPLTSNNISSTIRDEKKLAQLQVLTNFGYLFKAAAEEAKIPYFYNGFDTNCIELEKDRVDEFLGELNIMMKSA